MSISKKQQACVTRYVSSHYDKVTLTCPKGKRDEYKELAAKLGLSVNQLFIKAVEYYAAKQGIEIPSETDSDC